MPRRLRIERRVQPVRPGTTRLARRTGDLTASRPPGTGVSAAMRDVHNLAWMLAAAWRGHAGPALLESYAAEREAVRRRNTGETVAC